jgi:8-oxo-dGTP diphosphatase
MMEELNYCSRCRTPLVIVKWGDGSRPYCPECRRPVFLNPKLVVAAIVRGPGGVLLVRRNLEPGRGLWAMPGGYVDRGEVVEAAVAREVLEETGLRISVGGLVGLYSEEGDTIVLAVFTAEATGGELNDDSPEVQAVGFFPVDALPPLAFQRDHRVIQDWLRQTGQATVQGA